MMFEMLLSNALLVDTEGSQARFLSSKRLSRTLALNFSISTSKIYLAAVPSLNSNPDVVTNSKIAVNHTVVVNYDPERGAASPAFSPIFKKLTALATMSRFRIARSQRSSCPGPTCTFRSFQ
jgi:hypothetical protein